MAFQERICMCVCVCVNMCVCVCVYVSLDEPVCVYDSAFCFFLALTHFLFIMSSSSQIFCVRNKVHMRNFTGGCGKNTLVYMVRKYESDMYKLFRTKRSTQVFWLQSSHPRVTSAARSSVIMKFYSTICNAIDRQSDGWASSSVFFIKIN